MIQYGIEWPLASIDFEASALDKESYPIEVGIAVWPGPAAPITTWSALIEPTPGWVRDGVWFESAQKVHGISPAQLVGAMPPARAMSSLDALMHGIGTATSDNPYWEDLWLRRLSTAAGRTPGFRIDGLVQRLDGMDIDVRIGMLEHHMANPRPHRAGPDALLTLTAIAAGMGRTVETMEWHPE